MSRLIQVRDVKFRLWPILLAAVIMQLCLIPARELARWIYHQNTELLSGHVWAFVGMAILFQALSGLLGIMVMRHFLPEADSHLRWPPARSYVGLAIVVGISMGVIMLLADYGPDIVSQTAPQAAYNTDLSGALGWLTVMMSTGLAEETIFRGLLVGMLVVLVPGRIKIGRIDLPIAAYIVGILFAVAHYHSFIVDPLHLAIAQQLYAFIWCLVYVWLMERSRSLLAPIVAHGFGNAVEVGLVILMMRAWG
ncbi:CPBP family intramembrane glutamic endopeptidase [Neptunicella sp. SCSIO 80796]|uniref:CPBP family intramembrane glutamic endopeptidase n=1 Tax=Neptunicella plasticusilytica TaxID=3117012 RepID=UPI003A4D1DE4